MGGGFSERVEVLGSYAGDLVAGGLFPEGLARWTGSTWESLGGGVNGSVVALVEYDGDLVVAGDFGYAGGEPAGHIVRWDGESWHAMDDVPPGEWNGLEVVSSLTVLDGILIAAGRGRLDVEGPDRLVRTAKWNGESWTPRLLCDEYRLADPDAALERIRVVDRRLCIAGRNGVCSEPHFGFSYLARLDSGFWMTLDPCLEYQPDIPIGFWDVTGWNGYLVAGGRFTLCGASGSSGITYYDDANWRPFGSGFRSHGWDWEQGETRHEGPVFALTVYRDELYAGGTFHQAGGTPSMYIAKWVE